MANERKNDPFKPVQPSIPGLPSVPGTMEGGVASPAAPDSRRLPESQRLLLTAVGTFVALVAAGGLVHWGRTASRKAHEQPSSAMPAAAVAAAKPIERTKRPEALATGPGVVASTEDLSKAWSAKRFFFRAPVSTDPVPAMVVRLPGGQYWGFSLREPFGSCELAYVTDLQKLQTAYRFRASHPMVVDPCNQTIYDLLQYAPGESEGGLVRGAIVQGGGVRPPLAIEIRVEGKEVRAVRSE
jgi:hypothetical protein